MSSKLYNFVTDVVPLLSSYITTTFLDFFLVIFVVSLSFILFRTIEKMKIIDNFISRRKYNNKIVYGVFGAILSLFSFWYFNNPNWPMTLFIISILVFAFQFNYFFILGAMPILLLVPGLIYVSNDEVSSTFSLYTLMTHYLLIGLVLVISLLIKFIPWKNNLLFFLCNVFIFSTVIIVVIPSNVYSALGKLTEYESFVLNIQIAIDSVISFLSFGIITLLSKIVKKTEKLGEDIIYKDGFIIQKYANQQISAYINKNNIKHAFIIKFGIMGLDALISKQGLSYVNNIKKSLISALKSNLTFYKPLFYMQSNNTEYFALIPINDIAKLDLSALKKGNEAHRRNKGDALQFLEYELVEIINNYQKNGHPNGQCKIFAYVTMYGINNSNYNEINMQLESLSVHYGLNTKNIVYFMDSIVDLKKIYNMKNDVLESLNEFGPNEISISLKKDKVITKHTLYEIQAFLLKSFCTTKEEIWNLGNDRLTRSTIMCHVSAKGVKEFVNTRLNINKNLLIIDYPQYFLEQKSFNFFQLQSSISSYELNIKQVVLNIVIDNNNLTEDFLNNLQFLREQKFSIAFSNVDQETYSQLRYFDAFYVKYSTPVKQKQINAKIEYNKKSII